MYVWVRGGDALVPKLNRNNMNFAPLSIEASFPPVANIAVPVCVCVFIPHIATVTDAMHHKNRKAEQKRRATRYAHTKTRVVVCEREKVGRKRFHHVEIKKGATLSGVTALPPRITPPPLSAAVSPRLRW